MTTTRLAAGMYETDEGHVVERDDEGVWFNPGDWFIRIHAFSSFEDVLGPYATKREAIVELESIMFAQRISFHVD